MRIIKRKKGRKTYYYLQHSIRDKNRVITLEKYIGKKIPADIERIKLELLYGYRFKLYKKFDKIKNGFQKEWQRYPKTIKEKIEKQIAIAFTYNTNAIEGSKITLRETAELVEHQLAPNKPLSDIKETENHVKVFLDVLHKKEELKLDNSLILKWHKELFQDTKQDIAGKFRTYLVTVGGYIAPDWRYVRNLMNNLIKFYNKSKKMNPVELAARIHYKFETIHPFGDGNGRVGRLLMNYILWRNKYPMLIIEYRKRSAYYKALKGEEAFLNYFIRRYLKAHQKYLK